LDQHITEEINVKQRSKDRDILEGERTTAYFHAVTNQHRRKTMIHVMEGPKVLLLTQKKISLNRDFFSN
jgi:hypothetical protein